MSKGVLWFTVAGVFQITYGYKQVIDRFDQSSLLR